MNEIKQVRFGMGAPVLRKEDNALVTGTGNFTSDNAPANSLAGHVLRSPFAHARFEIRDVEAARAHPGVHAILLADDVAHLNPLSCLTPVQQPDGTTSTGRDIPVLCADTVRHVGDAIAFIVADTLATARDAAELIDIEFNPLAVVADTVMALDPDAPLVYPDGEGNLAFTYEIGSEEKSGAVFAEAGHVTEINIINNRLVSNSMEGRACWAKWDEEKQRFDVTVASQGVFLQRRIIAGIMGIEPEKLHVMTPDVGGGFGTKVFAYREYPLCLVAAEKTGRPVKWISDRSEQFVSDAQGRDNVVTARMAMDKDGRFLGLEIDLVAAMGAYLHAFGPLVPNLGVSMSTGLYDIPVLFARVRGSYTNTVPVDAYRGAGRPESAYLIERLVDQCARDMGLTPDEIRRRNFIRPDQLPFTTPSGRMYDTGEFQAHMEACMDRAGWDGFESRRAEAKVRGKIRGIGMASYIEACAFAGSEPALVELNPDGTVDVKIGTQSNGQGHATAYTQLAAEKLGLDYERINLRQGDTDDLENGGYTGGSRSIPLGGVSVVRASEELAEKMKDIAAGQLEASAVDIELVDGMARIVGTDRAIGFADIASAAPDSSDLKGEGEWNQSEATYPNGTHVCEVEIDPQTGTVQIVKYTIVDDFGATVNPVLLEGQVHGGAVQGIGQCLNERVVYDSEGQLLTASFMDYCMPRADTVPNFDFSTRNVPSTTNAMGIKGAGEAGTIGSCPAVMNAVADAVISEKGPVHVDMPVTPAIMWKILNT